jgi:hypothetical protein
VGQPQVRRHNQRAGTCLLQEEVLESGAALELPEIQLLIPLKLSARIHNFDEVL